MPIVQELSARQIVEAFTEAVTKSVPLTFTCRLGQDLLSLHSRVLSCQAGRLSIEGPRGGEEGPTIPPGELAGVSFKLGHHKYIFTSRVESVTPGRGASETVLQLPLPQRMQRIQRRAFNRVEVPPNRSILAAFWEGGSTLDPAGEGRIAWEGWVSDLSAGGFQVRLPAGAAPMLEVGDVVGVRMDLGQPSGLVIADAQFRHLQTDERGIALVGFQFLGLNDTPCGREILAQVGRVVCDLQDLVERREQRGDSSAEQRPTDRRQFHTPATPTTAPKP
jgi:hypothetical protein